MRILYFSQHYTTHDRRFLQALVSASHDVWFLRLENHGTYDDRPVPAGVHVVQWPRGFQPADSVDARLALMPDFERLLDTIRPDLVHAGPLQSCGFMTALADVGPFLAMSWGSDVLVDADRDPAWAWMTKFTLGRSAMLLCDCDAVRLKVQQMLPYANDRIVQFPWGVDLQAFSPGPDDLNLRRRPGWDEAFIALATRSWEEIYGHSVLLEAFQQARARDPRLRLVLLGDGSLASSILQFIEHNGLAEAIYRPGRVPYEQIPRYMRAADLYVSAARSDGTSVSLVEAMATGLPVLVSDVPGNREWIDGSESGWVRPNDARQFSEAWLEAASMDASARGLIRARNRAIAERRANWPENVRQLLDAYTRLERLSVDRPASQMAAPRR